MASRLKRLRSDRKMSQRELSRITGIEQATLSRIERGEMSLLSPHVEKLAKALGVPISRLLGITSNISLAQIGSTRIPLLSYQQVASNIGLSSLAEDLEKMDFVLVDLLHSAKAFALRIEGDSMEPSFFDGDIVVIDLSVSVRPGDFVVAVESEGATLFRRYRDLGLNEDGNRVFELIPLNGLYAAIRSDRHSLTIKGVMVEHRQYRKRD